MVTSECVFSSFQLTNLETDLVYRNQSASEVINDVSSDGILQFVCKVLKISNLETDLVYRNQSASEVIKNVSSDGILQFVCKVLKISRILAN